MGLGLLTLKWKTEGLNLKIQSAKSWL